MSLPDTIIPHKTATIDPYGRLWIGRGYKGHDILVKFKSGITMLVHVLESGRANVGRAWKGCEVEVYILKKDMP